MGKEGVEVILIPWIIFLAGIGYIIWRGFREKSKQRTFCYCKNCMNELCADPNTQCYDAGSEVHYICGKCNWQTDFMFDAPVPIYLRCYPPNEGQGKPVTPKVEGVDG